MRLAPLQGAIYAITLSAGLRPPATFSAALRAARRANQAVILGRGLWLSLLRVHPIIANSCLGNQWHIQLDGIFHFALQGLRDSLGFISVTLDQ